MRVLAIDNEELVTKVKDLSNELCSVAFKSSIDLLLSPAWHSWMQHKDVVFSVSGSRFRISLDSTLRLTLHFTRELMHRSSVLVPWQFDEGDTISCSIDLTSKSYEQGSKGRARLLLGLSHCLPLLNYSYSVACLKSHVDGLKKLLYPLDVDVAACEIQLNITEDMSFPTAEHFREMEKSEKLLWIGALVSDSNVLLRSTENRLDPFLSTCQLSLKEPSEHRVDCLQLTMRPCLPKSFLIDVVEVCLGRSKQHISAILGKDWTIVCDPVEGLHFY